MGFDIKAVHADVMGLKMENGQMGLIVFLLSILGAGTGTVVAAFLQKDESKRTNIIIYGLLQYVATAILVGWFWAIWTGFLIWKNSK